MASFTRKAIMDSCVRLLEERPLDKISVKDIVEDCGINRNTFYYHFSDLPSLVEAIIREDAEQAILSRMQVGSLLECLQGAMDFTLRRRRAALHIYQSGNREAFERYLFKICQHVVSRYVDQLCGDLPVREEDRRIIIDAYKCECFGQVINWLDSGLKEDLQKDVVRLCQLREGMAREMLRRSMDVQP